MKIQELGYTKRQVIKDSQAAGPCCCEIMEKRLEGGQFYGLPHVSVSGPVNSNWKFGPYCGEAIEFLDILKTDITHLYP